MIYGSMILESNFNKLVDPIETIREYYENEISLLNECIYSFNEDGNSLITVGDQEDNQTSNKTKSGFLKNIIERLKEILKKFIEWCKKLYYTIKGHIIKDSDGIKKDLDKAIKNIQKATTVNELKKYGKQIGLIMKVGDSSRVIFFGTEKYVSDINEKFKDILNILNTTNKKIINYIETLEKDGKLSEDTINNIEKDVNSIKETLSSNPFKTIDKSKYFFISFKIDTKTTVETLRNNLLSIAKTAYSSIDYIDKEIQNAVSTVKTLENNAAATIGKLNRMTKDDIVVDRESVNAVSTLINSATSAGKQLSQLRIKKLNSVKNIYRIGTEGSLILSTMI